MSGPDTIRGFNFQHAVALHAALDLLGGREHARIEIEGDDDVIDFQVLGVSDERRRVAQVKSRATSIGPQEIIAVINRWRDLVEADDAQFEYVTDAHLGREAASKLVRIIRQLVDGQSLGDAEADYLRDKGLADDQALLARVRVAAQQPPVGALLAQAEMRVLRVVGAYKPVSAADAEAAVDRLFRVIATAAGQGERNRRRVTREDVAELLGVDLAAIDAGSGWSPERAEQYRAAVLQEPRDAAAVELGLQPVAPEAALTLVDGRSRTTLAEPATRVNELLDEAEGAMLVGRGGSGKTTSLAELAAEAVKRGLVPIAPDLVAYRAGSLRRLLHQQVEAHLKQSLAPGGLDAILASGDVVVLADGVTERPSDEAAELRRDLAELRRDWPVRVIATGRRASQLRAAAAPVYELQGLEWEARERIAEAIMAGGRDAARMLAVRLGDAVEIPLLLRMGLSLVAQGSDPNSVEQLYGEFVAGLAARAGEPRPDAALAAAGICCLELVADDRFDADAYWWRSSMRAALDALSQAGVFEVSGLSAEAAIDALVALGLLHERGAAVQLGFLHDSFRDYLAARALVEDHAALPVPFDRRYEQVADLATQAIEVASTELLVRLCDNPVAAAQAAQRDLDVPGATQELAQELLRQLVTGFSLPAVATPHEPGVSEWAGAERLYVAIHEGDGLVCESREQFGEVIATAVLVTAYDERPTSLRIAVLAWQELLRAGLDQAEQTARPWPIPSEPEELAAKLAEYFRSEQAAASALADALCPRLSDQINEIIGWQGFEAHLSPEGRDHFQDGIVHRLSYRHDTDRILVAVGDTEAEQPGWSRTFAEYFMHDPPEREASNAVAKALKKLLATWGP